MPEEGLPEGQTHQNLPDSIRSFFRCRPHFPPALIAAIMLFVAVGNCPYDYYRFLRWVVCAAAIFVAYQSWAWKRTWGLWLFGVIAVLFNPIVPIHFSRSTWAIIDLVAAGVFGFASVILKIGPGQDTSEPSKVVHRDPNVEMVDIELEVEDYLDGLGATKNFGDDPADATRQRMESARSFAEDVGDQGMISRLDQYEQLKSSLASSGVRRVVSNEVYREALKNLRRRGL